MRSSILSSLLWGWILLNSIGQCQLHYVMLNHPVYQLLDFFHTASKEDTIGDLRPYTRGEIRTLLERLNTAPATLGSKHLIQRYLDEFSDRDHHLIALANNFSTFTGDAELRWLSQAYRDMRPFHKIDLGAEIRGTAGGFLSYQADISTIIYFANLDLNTGYGIKEELAPVRHQDFKSTTEGDVGITQLIFSTSWGYIFFGSDYYRWGPAKTGNLLLNITQYPITNIHAVTNIGPFKFIHLVGILNSLYPFSVKNGKEYAASQRKISAHRLEFPLFSRFRIGLSESVIYNRDFEITYLNPLQPFAISEVYSGDTDNNLAGVDIQMQLSNKTISYFELLLDDVDFMQNWFKNYVNKWAVLGGIKWNQPLGMKNSFAVLEVVRVEPYVYTHQDSANHYEYYGQSIGYDIEPNSLHFQFSFTWFKRYNLWHSLSVAQTWHGEGDRIFGNPEDTTRDKQFLVGKKESKINIQWQTNYEFYENMWVRFAVYCESATNPRIDDTFNKFGQDYTQIGLLLGLDLNY